MNMLNMSKLVISEEYGQLVQAGFKDVSSLKDIERGKIWFANDKLNWECGVFANGYIRYINLNNPSSYHYMTGAAEYKPIVKLEPLAGNAGYRNAMKVLFEWTQKHKGSRKPHPLDKGVKREIKYRKLARKTAYESRFLWMKGI